MSSGFKMYKLDSFQELNILGQQDMTLMNKQ